MIFSQVGVTALEKYEVSLLFEPSLLAQVLVSQIDLSRLISSRVESEAANEFEWLSFVVSIS